MTKVYYRVASTIDPEERLEDAAMTKAFYDEYGDDLVIQKSDDAIKHDAHFFGRFTKNDGHEIAIAARTIDYWNDETFLKYAQRSVILCDLQEAELEIARLHALGQGAFLKSIRSKELVCEVPAGTSMHEALGDMIWSFIDCGKILMVQPLVTMEYEQRFFVVDGEVVTWSPVGWNLTPLDTHSLKHELGYLYKSPRDKGPVERPEIEKILLGFAKKVAKECKHFSIVIDCAFIDGKPGIIEYNDGLIGQFGLYACDPRLIAKASRKIIARPFKSKKAWKAA